MSIASLGRNPLLRLPAAPIDERPPMIDTEPPLQGRPELDPWHPAFDTQLAADLADFEDEAELDEGVSPRYRVRVGIPPALVPPLDHQLMPMLHALTAELLDEISGRGRFQTVTPADLSDAAETFVRYRLSLLWALFVTLIGMPAACSSLI